MIFSLHGRWKVEYVAKEYVLSHLHACKICFTLLFVEENVWVIWVLIFFIKGYFLVNYVFELRILW